MLSLLLAASITGQCQPLRLSGLFHRRQCVTTCQPATYTYAPAPTPQAVPIASGAVPERLEASGADPYGFLAWLNSCRAAAGLAAVVHDANLAAWAAANNARQAVWGLGHHLMGPARRQNAGWGSAAVVWPAWAAHGPHAAALFDPGITVVGIAWDGSYWTFSAN